MRRLRLFLFLFSEYSPRSLPLIWLDILFNGKLWLYLQDWKCICKQSSQRLLSQLTILGFRFLFRHLIEHSGYVSIWFRALLSLNSVCHLSFHKYLLVGILIKHRRSCLTWRRTGFQHISFQFYISKLCLCMIQSLSIFSQWIFHRLMIVL